MKADPFRSEMTAQQFDDGQVAITYRAETGLFHTEILPATEITHPRPRDKRTSTAWTRLRCSLGQHVWDHGECMICDRRQG